VNSFMVVSTFKQGTDMAEVMTVVAEEQAKVAELKAAGHIGALYLSTVTRGTVFLEIFADDEDGARAIVTSLPMAKWWDLDVFPINVPVPR
jgi:muconolactone delta-isomerase